jgi:hypothetical protein
LFQQIDSNAKEFGVTDRFNPEQSTVGAAKFAKQNAAKLRGVLGREPTGAELYLAHQQGGAGAARLLSDRDRPVNTLLSDDAITLNGGSLDMTAGEFADLWINKWNATSGGRATNAAQATPPPAQLTDNQPEATTSLGVQPSAPASEAGAFVQTPTGQGENLGTDRTGGESFKAAAATTDTAPVSSEVSEKLASVAQRAAESISPKVKRQLKSLGFEVSQVNVFKSQEEAQTAIDNGELEEGDAMVVDGELFILEGE